MLINSNGKLFGKINVLDFLVLLVILAVVGGVGYKFSRSGTDTLRRTDKIRIEFFVEEAPKFAVEAIEKGDILQDFQKGSFLGNVVDIEVSESVSYSSNADGEITKTSRDGYNSVHIVAEGGGLLGRDGGVTINNFDYFIGHTTILRVGSAKIMGRVYNIERRETV